MDPEFCDHESVVEVSSGKATGRDSNGNEYITERCEDCGATVGGYWTGGVI